MRTLLCTFVLIACLMLVQGSPLDVVVDDVHVRDGTRAGNVPVNPVQTQMTGQQCKSVGSPCSISDECCTLRCASYLHACVT